MEHVVLPCDLDQLLPPVDRTWDLTPTASAVLPLSAISTTIGAAVLFGHIGMVAAPLLWLPYVLYREGRLGTVQRRSRRRRQVLQAAHDHLTGHPRSVALQLTLRDMPDDPWADTERAEQWRQQIIELGDGHGTIDVDRTWHHLIVDAEQAWQTLDRASEVLPAAQQQAVMAAADEDLQVLLELVERRDELGWDTADRTSKTMAAMLKRLWSGPEPTSESAAEPADSPQRQLAAEARTLIDQLQAAAEELQQIKRDLTITKARTNTAVETARAAASAVREADDADHTTRTHNSRTRQLLETSPSDVSRQRQQAS